MNPARWGVMACSVILAECLSAGACTCPPAPTASQSLSDASAVFIGRAASRRPIKLEGQDLYAYTFAVERAWKGVFHPEVTVLTGSNGGDCGWPFELGATYLVYGYGEAFLTTNLCARTCPTSRAAVDLQALGPPKTWFVEVARFPLRSWVASILGSLATLAIGVVIGFRWAKARLETEFEPFEPGGTEPRLWEAALDGPAIAQTTGRT